MALNLQVENAVSAIAQPVKDQNGNTSSLTLSTDKVGIGTGTTNPAPKLEVVGNWTDEDGALRLTGDKPTLRFSGGAFSGNQSWILHVGGNGPGNLEIYRRTGAPPAQGGPWSLPVMVMAPTGNVGIETVAPTEKLEVNGNILATGDIRLTNADCAEDFDTNTHTTTDATISIQEVQR
jgi:hypothetical protein